MLLGLNGAAIELARVEASSLWLVLVFGVAMALSFVAERMEPYQPGWNHPRDDVARDWLHFVVNETSNALSLLALPIIVGWNLPSASLWPHTAPFVLQVVGAILVFDLGITFAHWASHRVPWLWRFHAVHHSITRLYGLNGLMKHPVHQAIEMLAGILPLVLLGIPPAVATALAICTGIQLLMQHSNVDYRVGPLRHVLALNQGHRFHHLKWPELGDVNFGLFTSLGDRILGTWTFDAARAFASDDLGIASQPDFPSGYIDQLAEPFIQRS